MAEILNIDHEVGDLSEYDTTVTDGGDLSVETAAQIIEEYGLQCVIDDTTAIYGEATFTQLSGSAFRYRFYIDPNGLTMADGDAFRVVNLQESTNTRSYVGMNFVSGNYNLFAFVIDDASSFQGTSAYTISDSEHFVEVAVVRSSGESTNDATLTLFIDGAQQEQVTGLDVFSVSQPDNVRIGAVQSLDAGTSGTFYLDDFILRDDNNEIGGVILGPLVGGKLVSGGGLMGGRLVR